LREAGEKNSEISSSCPQPLGARRALGAIRGGKGVFTVTRARGAGLEEGENDYVFCICCCYFAFHRHSLFQIVVHKSLSIPRKPVR
jgi:hypothetical protein